MVCKEYEDSATGLRFIEDDRGVLHLIPPAPEVKINPGESSINVTVENNETSAKENKRLKRIVEALRSDNVWLWEAVSIAIRKKKTPQRALDELEKKIKERQRA